MKKIIYLAVLILGFSTLAQAKNLNVLGSAETMAYLVNMQQGNGYQTICTYRSATRLYGVHEVQASMINGCQQNLAYTATWEGGGVLRVFGTSNRAEAKRLGYRPSPTPTITIKPQRLCDNPNVTETFNQKTGEMTDCKTGKVTISPEIKALKEQGLWPY